MQLFALNEQNKLVSILEASKQQDFFCLECGQAVRKRGGSFRKDHFYHSKPNPQCRQSGKSLEHLQVQLFLQNVIGTEQVTLEKRFDEISRVADVCWDKEKLIFEIQCSPIAAAEIHQRNHDYLSLGYQVVWILHDERYNQKHLSAAELYLLNHPHYYTNMDAEGLGIIYDQKTERVGRYSKHLSGLLSIQPQLPYRWPKINDPSVARYRKVGFAGDYFSRHFQNNPLEAQLNFLNAIVYIGDFIKKIYGTLFKMLLEKSCWRGN